MPVLKATHRIFFFIVGQNEPESSDCDEIKIYSFGTYQEKHQFFWEKLYMLSKLIFEKKNLTVLLMAKEERMDLF